MKSEVLRCGDLDAETLAHFLESLGIRLQVCPADAPVPHSYWGESEAGLKQNRLYARADTPLHSVLHEACHFICLDEERRRRLDTDAGSDDAEESAVCYLQILLASELDGMGRDRMFSDMDAWGYSFRLGSSRAWFENDAADALDWLRGRGLVDAKGRVRR